jgi:hypothetical protein
MYGMYAKMYGMYGMHAKMCGMHGMHAKMCGMHAKLYGMNVNDQENLANQRIKPNS